MVSQTRERMDDHHGGMVDGDPRCRHQRHTSPIAKFYKVMYQRIAWVMSMAIKVATAFENAGVSEAGSCG